MADSNWMPIGRFARSCRLSVKALRHYGELGLLEPAYVDPQSGYRYYGREQARDAVMIGMLRSLGLPLAVIRDALRAEAADLKSLLDGEAQRVQREVAERERALLSLRHIAGAGSLAPWSVELREEPARRVATLSGTTDAARLIADTTELIAALLEDVAQAGLPVEPPIGSVNEFSEDEDRIEVRAFAAAAEDGRGFARARVERLPGALCAWLLHEGPYETLGLAHHALYAWAQERGHPPQGPIIEVYRNDPAEVPAEALATEVSLPLEA
ncbi:MAG: MerR family transcriptional regulator [Proteobacteria bacterium]|nr:MerR family transcriptional regulator [Pseudomonadota bacterium]